MTHLRLAAALRSSTTRRILRCVAACAISIALSKDSNHDTCNPA